jgi:hypothetical protein
MCRRSKTLILGGASMIVVAGATALVLSGTPSGESLLTNAPVTQPRTERKSRNLSLQPEAFKVSRRLLIPTRDLVERRAWSIEQTSQIRF